MNDPLQPHIETEDRLAQKEKCSKYQGTAKIKISCLRFEAQSEEQFLRPKNIKRLKRIFATEGCHRFVPEHYVAALISQSDLDAAIERSGVSQAALFQAAGEEPPKLEILEIKPLRFLHGRHRLQAASEYLSPDDDWWIADLYLDDMSRVFKNRLREEYSNSANFCDGEIFRHIRCYHKQKDTLSEKKWWARLTKDKSKDLKRVLEIEGLRQAFDDLLHVPGLWPEFHIGSMRRYLVLKCHEELASYLCWIRKVWFDIAGGDLTIMQMIDETSVKLLETRAPKASREDANFIIDCMKTGKLFRFIADVSLREKIIQNIHNIERIIPTLHTFCEDTKYLEPCAIVVKKLLEPKLNDTVKMTLRRLFRGAGAGQRIFLRQEGERRYVQVEGNQEEFEFNYKQLWMYAMRHFPDLVNMAPRKEPYKEKPVVEEPNPILWHLFAELAMKLGFESDKIRKLGSARALDQAIRTYLLRIAEYVPGEENLEDQVTRVKKGLEKEDQSNSIPTLTNDMNDTTLQRRCGRPFEDSQAEVKKHFYMRFVYVEETNARYITSFFVQRAIFIAFFGDGVGHTVSFSDSNLETMDESMSMDDQEQNHSRRTNDWSYDDESSRLVSLTSFPPIQDFNNQHLIGYTSQIENFMISNSFRGNSRTGHVRTQYSVSGLPQLASEDLKTSASQTVVLMSDPTYQEDHMVIEDASSTLILNTQTVVSCSDHAYPERHSAIDMDIDNTASDVMKEPTSQKVVLWNDSVNHEQHANVIEEESVNFADEPLQIQLTSESLEGSVESSASQAVVLWKPIHYEKHTTTENIDVKNVVPNVSENINVENAVSNVSGNIKVENAVSNVFENESVNSFNERNQWRKRQKQHSENATSNEKDLDEAISTDQAEKFSDTKPQKKEFLHTENPSKKRERHGNHDSSVIDRVPGDGKLTSTKWRKIRNLDNNTDHLYAGSETDVPLSLTYFSNRREDFKSYGSSTQKRTERVPGADGIKRRKIKNLNDKTSHFYAKSETDAFSLSDKSSKRHEDFENRDSLIQKRNDRVPGDGIKWRKIENSATYWLSDFEEEL